MLGQPMEWCIAQIHHLPCSDLFKVFFVLPHLFGTIVPIRVVCNMALKYNIANTHNIEVKLKNNMKPPIPTYSPPPSTTMAE